MDFVKSYFFTNETLGSWTLFSLKLDSPVIKTLEIPFFTLSECLSNVLITGESNPIREYLQADRVFIDVLG